MTKQFHADDFTIPHETTVQKAVVHRGEYGRTFDLHPALFAITFGAYMSFIGLMGLVFADAELAIPLVIFAVFVVGFFGTPALWARMAPPPAGQRPAWASFMRNGFECLTGHVSAKGAMVQVLIMPLLLLCWALAMAIIVACTF